MPRFNLGRVDIPRISLDVSGDGIADVNLLPSDEFDPVSYLQIMKATVNSLDLSQSKIKALDKRIDSVIRAIQKDKVEKAKLKANVFKFALEKYELKNKKLKKLSKEDTQLLLDMLNKLLDNLN